MSIRTSKAKASGKPYLPRLLDLGAARVLPVATDLISTEVGERFYLKFGFEKVGKSNVRAMNRVGGGSIMFIERHLQDPVME